MAHTLGGGGEIAVGFSEDNFTDSPWGGGSGGDFTVEKEKKDKRYL